MIIHTFIEKQIAREKTILYQSRQLTVQHSYYENYCTHIFRSIMNDQCLMPKYVSFFGKFGCFDMICPFFSFLGGTGKVMTPLFLGMGCVIWMEGKFIILAIFFHLFFGISSRTHLYDGCGILSTEIGDGYEQNAYINSFRKESYIYILFASPHFLHPFIFRNQTDIYRVQLVNMARV